MHPFASVLAQTGGAETNKVWNQAVEAGQSGAAFIADVASLIAVIATTNIGAIILAAAVLWFLFHRGRAILFRR